MFKALVPVWIALGSFLSGCPFKSDTEVNENNKIKISQIGKRPRQVNESSGLLFTDSMLITHGDGGNPQKLFTFRIIDNELVYKTDIELESVNNVDWEDITSDNLKSIYIGDFGNNSNKRKDLRIYKLNSGFQVTDIISFAYPDQVEFPPANKKHWNYDCEAFFWYDNNFYLFSKNIKWPYTRVYKMNSQGNIALIDSLYLASPVTAADISPGGNEIALLTYGKVFFFDANSDNGQLVFTPSICKQFRKSGQVEAIAYINENELVITNEKGKVFLLSRTMKE